ncbi:hypothetical protein [Amycolatopsis lexingtonensis]|uniref:hypothetical protein n=1 Tax=Amycolatopsis lexingtonensis TaxID=218822 RepID=UPI003F6E9B92
MGDLVSPALAAAAANENDGAAGALVIVVILLAGAILAAFKYDNRRAAERNEAEARSTAQAELQKWTKAAAHPPVRGSRPPPVQPPVPAADRGPWPAGQARRVIRDGLAGLTTIIAGEARAHAEFLRSSAGRRRVPGKYRDRVGAGWGPPLNGTRPETAVFCRLKDVLAWSEARHTLLSAVHEDAARLLLRAMFPRKAALTAFERDYSRVGDGAGVPVLPSDSWEKFFDELHTTLTSLADRLATIPAPEPPAVNRPDESRLRDDMSAEAVSAQLDDFITGTAAQRRAAAAGTWPGPFHSKWQLDGGVLDGFVTREVRERLARATPGFAAVAKWRAKDIAPDCHARIYLAHIDIALDYLTEVRANMDSYAQYSGQRPGDRITINAGYIDGVVNVKSSIGTINTTLAPVEARGDTALADAIRALGDAVRRDPDLTDDARQEALHHVEDLAEAAAEPGAERKRSRAKAALAAVTEAAKSATQLAQTVATCQEVIGKLF